MVIVGAGFAGLYMLQKLRTAGLRCVVIEAGDDVGGTWYWNRYPGARCDVESVHYSYSFSAELDQEWTWTERYAGQPEILRYLQHVADRFDLRRDIQFSTRVASAAFDEGTLRWDVTTKTGDTYNARFCIMATGCLSTINRPDIAGCADFQGPIYHTGNWPHEKVDFTGLRVGIIGTGSSACQAIPLIANEARELIVLQRTPNHCVPAHNHPLPHDYVEHIKSRYPELRRKWRESEAGSNYPIGNRSALEVTPHELDLTYQYRWDVGGIPFLTAFDDILLDAAANATAANFVTRKIGDIVIDPEAARRLTPTHHPIGAKRICIVTDYYETFNRDNVRLISVRETPIERILPGGIALVGEHIPLDALIFATGFDTMTGSLMAMDIRGRRGTPLREAWADEPATYLGLMVADFPNMFLITGPGSPSVLSVMTMTIEQHVEWIAECIDTLEREGVDVIEASPEAQREWTDHVHAVANQTLYPAANTWYTNANIEGKRRGFNIYVGGYRDYDQHLERVRRERYAGFILTSQRHSEPASQFPERSAAIPN